MDRWLPILARWLHLVCLALWLGGLVAIGALVAPTAFHVVGANPALAGHIALQKAIAGSIVGGSLHIFNVLCLVCGALLLLSNGLLLTLANRRWVLSGLVVALVLLTSALYLGFFLTPALDAAQRQGEMPVFDRLHHQYEQISILVQFPLLLLLALLSALRDSGSAPEEVRTG